MYNSTQTANSIATDWPTQIGKLPADLAAAVATYEEADYATPPAAVFDPNGVTRENVQTAVDEYARTLALASTFEEAKRNARAALAVSVIHAAADAVPTILERLRPDFDRATTEYVEAVGQLPDSFDGDYLADADTAIQAAYKAGCAAAKTIRATDGWLASLGDLPTHGSYQQDRECRVLSPATRTQLADLMTKPRLSKAEDKLVGLYLVAARAGIGFEIRTPAEATALRKSIDAQPVVRHEKWISAW